MKGLFAAQLGALLSMCWMPSAAAAVPVAVYPVQGRAITKTLTDAQNLVVQGLHNAEPRGVFQLRKPLVLPATCPAPVTPACVGTLAANGLVVFATAKPKAELGQVQVTLWLVREDGKLSRPVRFDFDEFRDLRPVYDAISVLEQEVDGFLRDGASPQTASTTPAPRPVEDSPRQLPEASVSDASPGIASVPASSGDPLGSGYKPAPEDPAASPWMGRTGMTATIAGGALLAGGAVLGLLARGINDDLTARHAAGTLVPGDRGNYQRLTVFSVLANTLMIGGGVITVGGATLWIIATPSGPSTTFSGRF